MTNQNYTMPPWDEENPIKRLDALFAEVGQIIEDHPELVESMDKEQFNKAVNLVEGVETDNLPARLRELAREMRGSIKELLKLKIKSESIDLRDLQRDFDDDSRALEEIANELEKEG